MTSRYYSSSIPALTTATALALVALATLPVRDNLYTVISDTASDSGVLRMFADKFASGGLLILVASAALLAVWSRLRDRTAFWRLTSAGIGVVGAYLLSEVIKLMVAEHRPCRGLNVATVMTCPEVGDWSWPSNHSVIAAAFATACMLVSPRTGWFAVPVAVLIAYSRVAAGVHYVHDVASGLALGTVVVTLVAMLLRPVVNRLSNGRTTGSTVTAQRN